MEPDLLVMLDGISADLKHVIADFELDIALGFYPILLSPCTRQRDCESVIALADDFSLHGSGIVPKVYKLYP